MQGAPTHIVTHKETLSRYALARKYPGKYSLTVERNGWLTRYVSATPDTALAEAWLNTLSEEAPDIWSLIDRQDGHGFFMHVKDGVVREAKHIDLEEVSDIKLKLSKQVYVTDPLYSEVTDENAPWKESNTKRVSALSESDVNLYALKANRIPLIAASVASFLLIILTAGMMWSASSPHQVDVAPHVAPRYVSTLPLNNGHHLKCVLRLKGCAYVTNLQRLSALWLDNEQRRTERKNRRLHPKPGRTRFVRKCAALLSQTLTQPARNTDPQYADIECPFNGALNRMGNRYRPIRKPSCRH
ncbi:hypothetical protein JCM19232_4980 [Vibrio ishigakensis]|uniref:Uncharacterized protein n=1 Tax=Vibrio ishigakensis TaxID=1481914 RepID=A0A0B8PEX2_9VIBR|nr:hypothetical protein JCM19232_4980 [Vibrio ishigakensis]